MNSSDETILKRLSDILERATSIMEDRHTNDEELTKRSLAEAIYIEFVTNSLPSEKESEAFAETAIHLAARFALAWKQRPEEKTR